MRGADGRSGARGRCRGSTPAHGRRGGVGAPWRRPPVRPGVRSAQAPPQVGGAPAESRSAHGRGADTVSAPWRRRSVPACTGRSQPSAGPHPRGPVHAPRAPGAEPRAAAPRRLRGPISVRAGCRPARRRRWAAPGAHPRTGGVRTPGARRPPPRRDHPRRGRMRPSRPAVQRFRCGGEARGPAEPRHVRPQDGSAGTVSSPGRASPPQAAGMCGTGAAAWAGPSAAGRGQAPRSGPGRRGTVGGRAGGHVWPRVSGSTVSGSSPRRLATSSTTVS